jgi:hypothetical protein
MKMCDTSAEITYDDDRWPPSKDTCNDCKWWYPVTPFGDDLTDTGCGECRYGPPTAIEVQHTTRFSSAFPIVSEYDWCGRFERRNENDIRQHQKLYEISLKRKKEQINRL